MGLGADGLVRHADLSWVTFRAALDRRPESEAAAIFAAASFPYRRETGNRSNRFGEAANPRMVTQRSSPVAVVRKAMVAACCGCSPRLSA